VMDDTTDFCQVCGKEERKYKCPRCSLFSCSLACCKKHKVEQSCSGKREQSSYQSLKQLKDSDLRRDFHFLENVLSKKDSAKRTLSQSLGGRREDGSQRRQVGGRGGHRKAYNKKARINANIDILRTKTSEQNLDMHKPNVRRLVKACEERKVSLVIMSPGMTRREMNTSRFLQKKDKVYWRVQMVFVASKGGAADPSRLLQPDLECSNEGALSTTGGLVGIALEGVDEEKKIQDILAPFIDAMVQECGIRSNEAQRHALRHLRSRRTEVVCLLQSIPSPASCPVFTIVSETETLREALRDETVLEYPVFFVGLAGDMDALRRRVQEVGAAHWKGEEEDQGDIEGEVEEGGVDKEREEEQEEEEEEVGQEDEEEEDFMAALEEMGRKGLKDLHAIIREETAL
jgi:hypothetical protein